MDGISGASAVLALVGFAAKTIQELNELITSIRKAPKELLSLVRYLERLKDSLTDAANLAHRLHPQTDRHSSLDSITSAVEYCFETINSVKVLVNKAQGSSPSQNRLQKTLKSLRFVLKKDEIEDLQTQLDRAINALNLAISISSTHQIYDTHTLVTSLGNSLVTDQRQPLLIDSSQLAPSQSLTNIEKPSLLIDSSKPADLGTKLGLPSLDSRQPLRLVSNKKVLTWYNGILGSVTIHKSSKPVGNPLTIRAVGARFMSEEMVLVLRPSFLKRYIEAHFVQNFGRIPRTLNTDHVVGYKNPIFEMCRSGDTLGIYGAFCSGRASPMTVNPMGSGLLHCAAGNYQLKACEWLLDNGVEADRANDWGHKPLTWMGTTESYYKDRASTKTVLKIVRLLAQRQKDLSTFDISHCFQGYQGPPEGAELMLSEYPAQYDQRSKDDGYWPNYPTLAAILQAYAEEPFSWEYILRVLVRRGADLHAKVRRNVKDMNEVGYPCVMAHYGTPLDELFAWNRDISAAQSVAGSWLQILASEGYDPSAYLERERNMRAEEMLFTHASISSVGYDSPGKLFFELGDRPGVYWDWWIDPKSSTYVLREEFKFLTTTSPDWLMISEPWEESWPFAFPKWSKLHQGYARGEWYSQCKELLIVADARPARRVKTKAAKAARAQRSRMARKVPGGWPT